MPNKKLTEVAHTLFWIFISLYILGVGIYHFSFPMFADDWGYNTVISTYDPFSWIPGRHPGRNIAEFLHIFPIQFIAPIIGAAAGDYLFGMKAAQAIAGIVIMPLFIFISTLYASLLFGKIKGLQKYAALFFIFYAFYFADFYFMMTHLTQLVGSFTAAMFCWYPLAYYFSQGKAPEWAVKNPEKAFGVWLAACYIGTQNHDTTTYFFSGLSIFLLIYLALKPDPISGKAVKKYTYTYLAFAVFQLLRNTLLTGQVDGRRGNLSFFPSILLERLMRFCSLKLILITLVIALVLASCYLIKFIKTRAIPRQDFFLFSLFTAGLGGVILQLALNTRGTFPAWMIAIGLVGILLSIYSNNEKYALYLAPTLILYLSMASFNIYRWHIPWEGKSRFDYIASNSDRRLIELFTKAEQEGAEQIDITQKQFHDLNIYFSSYSISEWMQIYGYTKKALPIVVIPD